MIIHKRRNCSQHWAQQCVAISLRWQFFTCVIDPELLCEVCSTGSILSLPCPALPCPALPCLCQRPYMSCIGPKICAQSTPTLIVLSAVSWTWSRVGGNGPAPPLHPSRALRPCQNTQSTQQTSLMAATMWSRVQAPTPMPLSSGAASGTTTRRNILMSLPNSGCVGMQSRQ